MENISGIKNLLFCITVLLCMSRISCIQYKGRVVEIEPSALEIIAHHFDQVLVMFWRQYDQKRQQQFAQSVKNIHESNPNDTTLYGVVNMTNDNWGKLSKYGNQSGVKLINKFHSYQMDKPENFNQLKNFYQSHVHPTLTHVNFDQLKLLQNFIAVFSYNQTDQLNVINEYYSKVYNFITLFQIRAVCLHSNQKPNLKLWFKGQQISTYENQLNSTNDLIDFFNIETLPLVSPLNQSVYYRIFGSSLNNQLILIYNESFSKQKQFQNLLKEFEEAARKNKEQDLYSHRVLFTMVSSGQINQYFDENMGFKLSIEEGFEYNYKIVHSQTDYDKFQLRKYMLPIAEYPPKAQNIYQFLEDVRMKKINPQYKSQSIPNEQNQTFIRTIVGDTFIKEIFETSNHSVLVLFIDTKHQSAHQDLLSALQNFTSKYSELIEQTLKVGVFDLAKNEHKLLTIRQAPQLVLFQRTNKKKSKTFKGNSTKESIRDWLNYELKDLVIPSNYGEKLLPLGGGQSEEL